METFIEVSGYPNKKLMVLLLILFILPVAWSNLTWIPYISVDELNSTCHLSLIKVELSFWVWLTVYIWTNRYLTSSGRYYMDFRRKNVIFFLLKPFFLSDR